MTLAADSRKNHENYMLQISVLPTFVCTMNSSEVLIIHHCFLLFSLRSFVSFYSFLICSYFSLLAFSLSGKVHFSQDSLFPMTLTLMELGIPQALHGLLLVFTSQLIREVFSYSEVQYSPYLNDDSLPGSKLY